jgi:hypothetical protein
MTVNVIDVILAFQIVIIIMIIIIMIIIIIIIVAIIITPGPLSFLATSRSIHWYPVPPFQQFPLSHPYMCASLCPDALILLGTLFRQDSGIIPNLEGHGALFLVRVMEILLKKQTLAPVRCLVATPLRLGEKSSSSASGDFTDFDTLPDHNAAAAWHPLDPEFDVRTVLIELSGVDRRLHYSSARLIRLFDLHDLKGFRV